MMSERNMYPFTASQWQELEHQALIFKYMVSGVPIPPHLIFTVKTSLDSSMSSNTSLFSNKPIGWGSFQMGFGRKADPEPGRCRRTDGKKWRCSKEAYPDSKYCERHMQRGRNRSRKPVEVAKSSSSIHSITTKIPNSTMNSTTSSSSLSPLSSSMISETYPHHLSNYHNSFLYPSLYPHSSPSRSPASCFSPQNRTTHHLFLDSGSYSQVDKGYNFDNVPYTPLTMSSSSDSQGFTTDKSKEKQNQLQNIGFESARTIEVERGEEAQKPLHHFFSEWPPKRGDSWLDIEENQSNYPSISTTQLSISMPLSTKELFQSKP